MGRRDSETARLAQKVEEGEPTPSPAEFTDSEGADKYLYPSDIGDVRGTLHGYKDIMKLTPTEERFCIQTKAGG